MTDKLDAATIRETNAPTEQDRARQIARDIREEFALDLMVGTADNLYDNFEDAVYRRIAAALQAERERTIDASAKECERFLNSLKDRDNERKDGAFIAITRLVKNIRALKAAQLPQGKTK